MNKSKLLILIILFCLIFNANYLDSIAGWLIFISQIFIIMGVYFCYNKTTDIFSPIVITYVGMLIPFSIKGMYILETGKFAKEDLILPLIYYIVFIFFFTLALLVKNKRIVLSFYQSLSVRVVRRTSLIITSFVLSGFAILIYILKMGTLNPQILISDVLGNRIQMQNSGGLYIQTLVLLILQSSLYINAISLFKTKRRIYLISVFFF
ncbi:hypothetical protein ACSZNE_12850 [Aeromonas caviae]|uniref:hypothetical protein n=1 Tax=Aeromonas caviae TaxID=648 RepID=UPI003EC68A9D